jgi:hypothetical protein
MRDLVRGWHCHLVDSSIQSSLVSQANFRHRPLQALRARIVTLRWFTLQSLLRDFVVGAGLMTGYALLMGYEPPEPTFMTELHSMQTKQGSVPSTYVALADGMRSLYNDDCSCLANLSTIGIVR